MVVIFERQFGGCFFVDDDGAVVMQLDGGAGDHGGHRAFKRLGDDVGFAFAGDQHQQFFRIEDRADAHGERAVRHFFAFGGIEIRAVLGHCDRGQVDRAGPGGEGGQRFIETDVAGKADPQQLQIHAAGFFHHFFIAGAFGFQIGGHAVFQMRVALVDVDPVEQMEIHVIAVGVAVFRGQSHIFVQIEGFAQGEVDLACFVHVGQFVVDVFHGGAGGQTEGQVRFRFQGVGDDLRGQRFGAFRCGSDDDIHFIFSSVYLGF